MEKLGKPITEIFMQKTPSRFLKAKSLRILWYVQKNTLFYCIYIVFYIKYFEEKHSSHLLLSIFLPLNTIIDVRVTLT